VNIFSEIQEIGKDYSGKAKIKMIACKIHTDISEFQNNGITWVEEYVRDSLESAKNMHYVVSWFDEEAQIPYDHGVKNLTDNGELEFKKSVVVGNAVDAYVDEVEIDGVKTKVLMTEGYINTQRYNKFYHWLKEEVQNGTIYGSVEVRGKNNGAIIYENNIYQDEYGNLINGRKPKIFDFSDLAIMYIATPADNLCRVVEVNKINDDEGAFDLAEAKNDTAIVELNKQVTDLNSTINALEKDKTNLETKVTSLESEISNKKKELSNKETELNTKTTELNDNKEVVTELNKEIVELKTAMETQTAELDALKAYKAEQEQTNIKTEINEYFTNSVSKQGFSDKELKVIKEKYVDSELNSLDELKKAETDLIVAKYKEKQKLTHETNNKNSDGFVRNTVSKKEDISNTDSIWE